MLALGIEKWRVYWNTVLSLQFLGKSEFIWRENFFLILHNLLLPQKDYSICLFSIYFEMYSQREVATKYNA